MSLSLDAAYLIDRYGAVMTLKRTGETDISLKGKRIPGTMVEAGGSAMQQRFDVKIATGELAASDWTVKAPRRGDRLSVDGRVCTILDAFPLGEGGTVAFYRLTVSG